MSDKNSPEVTLTREKTDTKVIFEHLFPGNTYESLRKFNPLTIGYLFDRYLGIGHMLRGINASKLNTAVTWDQEYTRRIEVEVSDKFSLGFSLSGATPIAEKTVGTSFKGHSFQDIVKVELGEHLGGVAEKRIAKMTGSYTWQLIHKLHPRYYEKPLYMIGILDKDNKPKGLIEFKEGPGLKKRVPTPKKAVIETFQPSSALY